MHWVHFYDFLFQDTTPSSGSLRCRNPQEHSDMLVLCLLFLWQRRNDTALDNIWDQTNHWSQWLRPLLLKLKFRHFWLRNLPRVCFWVSQKMWDPSQSYTLTAQPIALQLHCWVGGSEKRPIGLQFGTCPKIKQVICHYYSTVTTGKPSVILQEFFSNHAILMCTSKRKSHNLIKNTKTNSYCWLPVLFSA